MVRLGYWNCLGFKFRFSRPPAEVVSWCPKFISSAKLVNNQLPSASKQLEFSIHLLLIISIIIVITIIFNLTYLFVKPRLSSNPSLVSITATFRSYKRSFVRLFTCLVRSTISKRNKISLGVYLEPEALLIKSLV